MGSRRDFLKKPPGYCVECHKSLKEKIICDQCQEFLSNPPWDIEEESNG